MLTTSWKPQDLVKNPTNVVSQIDREHDGCCSASLHATSRDRLRSIDLGPETSELVVTAAGKEATERAIALQIRERGLAL